MLQTVCGTLGHLGAQEAQVANAAVGIADAIVSCKVRVTVTTIVTARSRLVIVRPDTNSR